MVGVRKILDGKPADTAQRIPKEEVARDNPWYTDDQCKAAEGSQKAWIRRRYHFIARGIRRRVDASNGKPLRVLDAGCGDGVQLQGLTEIPGLEIWGIDYNSVRTERARRIFQNVRIICGDLLHIPLKQNIFDVILCSQVIEHIPQDDVLLEQLAEVLKPRGLLILGTPNEGCLMGYLRNHIFERGILGKTDHVNFYREATLRRKIKTAGFEIHEVMRENWFFPHQRINSYLARRPWGFRIMAWMSKVIPSQTAGYYFKCVRCP
jgi:2-polyprenyl-3-methyl-5-hydroxy-6-metoxy-1,4-benzoquinol methylase